MIATALIGTPPAENAVSDIRHELFQHVAKNRGAGRGLRVSRRHHAEVAALDEPEADALSCRLPVELVIDQQFIADAAMGLDAERRTGQPPAQQADRFPAPILAPVKRRARPEQRGRGNHVPAVLVEGQEQAPQLR